MTGLVYSQYAMQACTMRNLNNVPCSGPSSANKYANNFISYYCYELHVEELHSTAHDVTLEHRLAIL